MLALRAGLAYAARMHVRRRAKTIALVLAVITAAASVSLAAQVLSTKSISVIPRVGVDAIRVADAHASLIHPSVPPAPSGSPLRRPILQVACRGGCG